MAIKQPTALFYYKFLVVCPCNYGLERHLHNMEHSKNLQPTMNLELTGAPPCFCIGGRTMDNVEHCIYKLLLGAKHGDSGLDNAEWQDSCLEEQTVGTVGRALSVLVSDFLAESLRDYYNILWKFHKNRLDSRS